MGDEKIGRQTNYLRKMLEVFISNLIQTLIITAFGNEDCKMNRHDNPSSPYCGTMVINHIALVLSMHACHGKVPSLLKGC